MDDPAGVDAYLAALAEPHRELLSRVRSTVRDACPEATEAIAYGMPSFRLRGRMLLSYAAHKRHCSLYPASRVLVEALGDALAPFLAEKATIRFTVDRPLPDDLLRRIVEVRVEEGAGSEGGR
jgi:uncharacterized protein YdhG (YjbR/CyaY superfamily)